MSRGQDIADVIRRAHERADALATGDRAQLSELLHPEFRWTSHAGERFDRAAYVRSNIGGRSQWFGQELSDVEVVVHEDTAVLRCAAVDTVDGGSGTEVFRMPMTQVWVRYDARWVLLAGHAGPRLGRRPGFPDELE
jgi:hypothetical protein